MTSTPPLDELASRIGVVSPLWKAELAATAQRARRTRDGDTPLLTQGIESIYEGYALHFAADSTRVVRSDGRFSSRLLLGDWCYAAGLCDIAKTGNVDAVRTLADLIADVASMASEAPEHPDDAANPREIRWSETLSQLSIEDAEEQE